MDVDDNNDATLYRLTGHAQAPAGKRAAAGTTAGRAVRQRKRGGAWHTFMARPRKRAGDLEAFKGVTETNGDSTETNGDPGRHSCPAII